MRLHGALGQPLFSRGSERCFLLRCRPLGRLLRLQLHHDGAYAASSWHVQSVTVRHVESGEATGFVCEQWLSSKVGRAWDAPA